MDGILSMVCPPGTACPLSALGLPEVLLWVLSFAVVFALLTKLKIFSRAPATLVSVVVGFLVLMAAPAALITVIATMSTGLIVAIIAFLVILSLIEIGGVQKIIYGKDKEGNPTATPIHPFKAHSTILTLAILAIVAILFWASGGAALLGLGSIATLFTIGAIPWVLVVVGIAVLWMLTETK